MTSTSSFLPASASMSASWPAPRIPMRGRVAFIGAGLNLGERLWFVWSEIFRA